MPFSRNTSAILLLLTGMCQAVLADILVLKTGEKVEGKIVSETDAEVTMTVQVTATIKDDRVYKRDEIEKVLKVQPEEEAWSALGSYVPGKDSLDADDYERAKAALQNFLTNFPKSGYAPVARERMQSFISEQKRVKEGEMKVDGKWYSPEKVKEERVQIAGHILFNRMNRAASAGQLTDAMLIFDQIEKAYAGSASYPDAIELARRIVPSLKVAAEQKKAQLKRRADDEKQRLATAKGTERAQLEALIKQEKATTDATVAATEKAGLKWFPLHPANDRSLTALASRASSETTRLNGLNVEKMRESLTASKEAVTSFTDGNLDAAGKSVQTALSAWPANEAAKRLQLKINEAKKAAPAPKPAAPSAPKSTSSSSRSHWSDSTWAFCFNARKFHHATHCKDTP